MIYKNMFLVMLLVPSVVVSDNDTRIKDLKNTRHEKEQELSALIEMINEKEDIIDFIMLKVQNIYPHCITTLNNEERKEFHDETISFQINFQKSFASHITGKQLFDRDLLAQDKDNIFELKRMRYLLIRYVLEYRSLNRIIKQYEKILEELIEIDNELDILQK